MPQRIIEETDDGYRRVARTQLLHYVPNGQFVTAEAFESARNAEIRSGYGVCGYGHGGYGE